MTALRITQYLAATVMLIPILIGMIGGIWAGKESTRLKYFCERHESRADIKEFQSAAKAEGYFLFNRTRIPQETIESKIAVKLMEQRLQSNQNSSDQVEVIVQKPGIGYYACVVSHNGTLISSTEYISSD